MKREKDDLEGWRERREHEEEPFPYAFPQMAPRFRRCCRWLKALLLLENICLGIFLFTMIVGGILLLLRAESVPWSSELVLVGLAALGAWFACCLLRHTPKLFWHCPRCGRSFPYYAPSYYTDVLKEIDCLREMERLHIGYIKRRTCPLVVPSACPECRARFFEMPEDLK